MSTEGPITGLCIVSEPNKCPAGYELLLRSQDRGDDCDLWKDSLFKARVTRYLCITRVFPLENGMLNNVLADITLVGPTESAPDGYSTIEETIDTREKATRKKTICVKMIHRNLCNDAVTDLVLLSKSKRPQPGYTLCGDINGLLLCFKLGPVPPETQQQNTPVRNAAPPPPASYRPPGGAPPPVPARPAPVQRQSSLVHIHAISGVPFQLSPKYQSPSNGRYALPIINHRSKSQIMNEFDYKFEVEDQVARGMQLNNIS